MHTYLVNSESAILSKYLAHTLMPMCCSTSCMEGEEFAVMKFDDGECVICVLELGKVFKLDNGADCEDLLHLVFLANLQQPSSCVDVVDASVKEDAS